MNLNKKNARRIPNNVPANERVRLILFTVEGLSIPSREMKQLR